MAPTREEIASLPLSSNAKIAAELLTGTGTRALDIGCGEGKFTRGLTAIFADVGGIDVKAYKIAEAAESARQEGVTVNFRTASGEAIPDADASYDTVVFSNSLHHMPSSEAALAEALRVLKSGGLLYVMEPVPAGNYHEATKLVNDETEIRTKAYQDLSKLAGVTSVREIMYRARRGFASFDAWKADQLDRDMKRKAKFDAQPDAVRSRFETSADREDGRLVFDQVYRVNLLRKL
jgi:ubiquinone/menaquinone biosynthesis C-methylase UbiE